MKRKHTGRKTELPHLQNIPLRTELGRKLRDVFAEIPDTVLRDADYSMIELRMLAHLGRKP